MPVARSAWIAVILAATLAGCSELRWHRGPAAAPATAPTRTEKTTEKLPPVDGATVSASTNAPPEYFPALYIPGSAQPSLSKSKNILTLPLRPPAAAFETEPSLPPLTPSAPAPAENAGADNAGGEHAAAEDPLHALHRKAALKWAALDAYGCRIRRREAIAGQPKPEELLVAKFRKEPFSAFFQWLGPEAKGREVVYVQGQHGNLIHTLTAPGDIFLVAGGTRFKIAPDSLLVKNKSRYPITEAGVGALIDRFGQLVGALERGEPRAGSAKYLGQLKRKEYESKVEAVLQAIAPGWEPLLPGGGQRLWCFDAEHHLPVLIVTHDDVGREVEYYCHDRFEFPGRYHDDDFNPDKLWAKAPPRAARDR